MTGWMNSIAELMAVGIGYAAVSLIGLIVIEPQGTSDLHVEEFEGLHDVRIIESLRTRLALQSRPGHTPRGCHVEGRRELAR